MYFSRSEATTVWHMSIKDRHVVEHMTGTPTAQSKGVDVLPVVCAGHVLLAKTNGVLALGDAVENLKILLRDALREVKEYG